MYIGVDLDQSSLQINDHKINRPSYFTSIDTKVNDNGLVNEGVKPSIIKIKRQFLKFKPILRLKILFIRTRTKVLESLIISILFYNLSKIV